MKRIWFDHYLALEDVLTLLRNDADMQGFTFIGSHSDPVILNSTSYDETFLVERCKGEAYVEFALDFCKRHRINAFSPRYEQEFVIRNEDRFHAIGVSLMVACGENEMLIAKNKEFVYEYLRNNGYQPLPDYRIVITADEFKDAVGELRNLRETVCMKPVYAEGGRGFWEITDDGKPSVAAFLSSQSSEKTVSLDDAVSILSQEPFFSPVMVMEKMEGTEYSVDCVATNGRLNVCVIREKPKGSFLRSIVAHAGIERQVEHITRLFNFNGAYNVQFITRKNSDEPLLLEINPRFSGGIALSSLSGVNLPKLAINLAMTGSVGSFDPPTTGIVVNQIHRGIVVEIPIKAR